MANVKRVPDGMHTVTPHLSVRGAADAIEFYKKAFGAQEIFRSAMPDSQRIGHAEIRIGDSKVFLNDEFPEMGCSSPQSLGGSPVTLHLQVEDVDSLFDRAVQAGATVLMPLADQFWGDRYGLLADPYGHRWSIASHVRDMTREEVMKAAAEAFASAEGCSKAAHESLASTPA